MSKKSKSFRDYAQRWRQTASQVQTPLPRRKMWPSLQTLPSTYYNNRPCQCIFLAFRSKRWPVSRMVSKLARLRTIKIVWPIGVGGVNQKDLPHKKMRKVIKRSTRSRVRHPDVSLPTFILPLVINYMHHPPYLSLSPPCHVSTAINLSPQATTSSCLSAEPTHQSPPTIQSANKLLLKFQKNSSSILLPY